MISFPNAECLNSDMVETTTLTMNLYSSSLFSKAYRTLPSRALRSRLQSLHVSSPKKAVLLPITAPGRPPAVPVPPKSEQKTRRKLQAALAEHRQNVKNDRTQSVTLAKPGDKPKKRLWKEVSVRTDSGMLIQPILQIHSSRFSMS